MSLINPYSFLDEVYISTKFTRTTDKNGNIIWETSSKFKTNDDVFWVELRFKQIFCSDGDGSYTMDAEYTIGDMCFGFSPFGTLNQITERCEKFKQFYLTLNDIIV